MGDKIDRRTVDKISARLNNMPWNPERIIERMTANFLSLANTCVEQGLLALYLKSRMEHGEFESALTSAFVDPGVCSIRTIRKYMRVAKFVLDNPKTAESADFMQLGISKQLMLSGASDDDIDPDENTIFGLTLDDWRALKISDLEAEINGLKSKNQKLKGELARGRDQLQEAREQIEDAKDRRRLEGKDDKEVKRKLDDHFAMIQGTLNLVFEGLDPNRLSKANQARVNGFLSAVEDLVESTRNEWLSKSR